MKSFNARGLAIFLAIVAFPRAGACAENPAPGPSPRVPEGFSIELVAGPPLVERPITIALDDRGRLYVGDSSGSNEPVKIQLEKRPHRIVRLEDRDGDGRYDSRTVFADRMMFPEGTLFYDGSLYVAAPPSIWKLTDADGDGVADHRGEWFQGKTLTGCANDLHGPYLGPDGWIYWCKGAFDWQTRAIAGREWKSRASHIFRCRPDGSGLEAVLTGGMDNPVDVAFSADGERFLSATFLTHPSRAVERDGLVHAIYGGVYGKDHGVLEGHPRTGELMPVLAQLGAAAPCGLECYASPTFGAEYQGDLFACQFNLRKVSRHSLRPAGASFVAGASDFVTSDNIDFHPTDVLEDADGSLLVVDTGGWYKLCCPTSQLHKPDVLGGIYRVRKIDAKPVPDPYGKSIPFADRGVERLFGLLDDARPAVRRRAASEFVARRESPQCRAFLEDLAKQDDFPRPRDDVSNDVGDQSRFAGRCDESTARVARVWAVSRIGSEAARSLVRQALRQPDARARHAAILAIGLDRDRRARKTLGEIVLSDEPANRRAAAESLGRLGDAASAPALLAAAAHADDRALEHSLTFALMELGDPAAIRRGLKTAESVAPGTLRVSLVALDQMQGGGIEPAQVLPLLSADDSASRATAAWLIGRHPAWGGELAGWFGEQLAASKLSRESLGSLLETFATSGAIQELLAKTAADASSPLDARRLALGAMSRARLQEAPASWPAALADVLGEANPPLLPPAVAAAQTLPPRASPRARLDARLADLAKSPSADVQLRLDSLAACAGHLPDLTGEQFELLANGLSPDGSLPLRAAAADALAKAKLSAGQLQRLCDLLESAGPLELHRLLMPFEQSTDEALGLRLVAALKASSARASLRVDEVRQRLAKYGPAVRRSVDELESAMNVDLATQRARIAELLPRMAEGDARRGLAVFHSAKAACSACHRLGYAGGNVGPDLTRIGGIRAERDLLESILYPSLSFVRSFEPMLIVTNDGRALSGLVRNETSSEITLATGPNQEVRLRRDEIEEMRPSLVSIMPAGLDRQLSLQELADLVTFLKSAK